MKKTSTFQNGLIWFGAGVSLAEILTGTSFAPLGMAKGFAAILIGHIIGCAMMLLAGLIGGRTGRSAMETVKMSFGQKGGLLFAFLNVLQLVGWTAIMIYDGALAVGGIFAIGRWVWCLVIGALIVLWIAVGITDLGWINKITMAALFILTLVLCKVIFFSGNAMVGVGGESLTFGAAVELAVAMPLSWLPLISDYTRDAEKPTQATWVSVLVYGAVSCWMYVIGMGAAIFTGEYDIAVIMVKAGLGIAVHAGESSGPEGVQEALELLGAKRIDHGVRAVEDLKLLERLLRERIPLNICYTSNVAGGLYTPGNHPLGELYSRGISVTVNTDDPQLLRVSLSQELQRVAEQYHWKIEELLKLQYYAVDAAFCTEERRSELLSRLHQFEATCQNLTAF